ncbi:MAG: hypothetical protein RIF34_09540, partial [Candidatus Kapaibacterium sp.]
MDELKERIFKVIERQIGIKEFENWLYSDENLATRMDEDLVFELYSFNYNQRGVDYEFRKLFLSFFYDKEFTEWKIIANLETLSVGCKEPERILADFYDLGYDDYPYLSSLGYNKYELEDCEYYGWSREKMISEIQKEAKQLLLEVQEWFLISSNTDLSKFEPNSKKTNMISYGIPN